MPDQSHLGWQGCKIDSLSSSSTQPEGDAASLMISPSFLQPCGFCDVNRLAPVNRRPENYCTRAASTVFYLQLTHMPYCSTAFHIIKNPRNDKHRWFHFVFDGNGNKRLLHAICCFL